MTCFLQMTVVRNLIRQSSTLNECRLFQFQASTFLAKLQKNQSCRCFSNSTNEKQLDEPVDFVISHEDFKWVQRLFPPSTIPEPPKHDKYPTPSGWIPPSDTVPDLPYFVSRDRYHQLPVYLLPPKNIVPFTKIGKIEGDIWALEKDIVDLLRPHSEFEPATRVHEAAMLLFIKEDYTELIRKYLIEKGF